MFIAFFALELLKGSVKGVNFEPANLTEVRETPSFYDGASSDFVNLSEAT